MTLLLRYVPLGKDKLRDTELCISAAVVSLVSFSYFVAFQSQCVFMEKSINGESQAPLYQALTSPSLLARYCQFLSHILLTFNHSEFFV